MFFFLQAVYPRGKGQTHEQFISSKTAFLPVKSDLHAFCLTVYGLRNVATGQVEKVLSKSFVE